MGHLTVSHTERGEVHKDAITLRGRDGGHQRFYPVLRGGGAQKFQTRNFLTLKHPLPVIDDQFLSLLYGQTLIRSGRASFYKRGMRVNSGTSKVFFNSQ